MFKLGFSTLGCPGYDADQVIELARSNGFSGVEIRFLRGEVDLTKLEEFAPQQIHETRRKFEDAGLEVISVDTSVRLSALDEANHQRQLGALRANCAIARGLGARYLRVFAGQVPEEGDRGAALDAIAAGLREGAAETASQGVTCLLETHDSFSTSDSVIDLYERGAGDDLMVLWDSLHTFRHGESVAESWAKLGSRVRHVHIKDSSRSSAESFDLVLTGTGSVPIPSILDVLEAARFDGYLSFEWEKAWLPEIEEPEVAIPHFARYMAAQATAT